MPSVKPEELDKRPGESDAEHADRLKTTAAELNRQLDSAEIVANDARNNAQAARSQRNLLAIVAGAALVMFLVMLGFLLFGDDGKSKLVEENKAYATKIATLESEKKNLLARVSDLEARKPTQVVQGMTSEQCTAMANDIVQKSCTVKATPVAKKADTASHGKSKGKSKDVARDNSGRLLVIHCDRGIISSEKTPEPGTSKVLVGDCNPPPALPRLGDVDLRPAPAAPAAKANASAAASASASVQAGSRKPLAWHGSPNEPCVFETLPANPKLPAITSRCKDGLLPLALEPGESDEAWLLRAGEYARKRKQVNPRYTP